MIAGVYHENTTAMPYLPFHAMPMMPLVSNQIKSIENRAVPP